MSASSPGIADAETVRLFFAIWPDPQARNELDAAAARVLAHGGARPVAAQNYHLTIAFLGAVPASKLPLVRQIADEQRPSGFQIRFDAYEYWPKPEVIVAAARTVPAELRNFWSALHHSLAESAFALNPKRLRPHVTLARKVTQAPVLPALSAFSWRAREFCLVRSDASESESVYTVLDTWPLLDEAKNI